MRSPLAVSRYIGQLLLTFLAIFGIGLLVQILVPFVAPSISVAYLDTRIFQSFTGFGLRETFIQSIALTLLLALWYRTFLQLDSNATDREHRRLLITGFLTGALTVYLGVMLTIRVPTLVVTAWVLQTTLQLIGGCYLLVRLNLKPHTSKWMALVALGLIGIMALMVIGALAFPAPRPSETFSVTVEVVSKVDSEKEDSAKKDSAQEVAEGEETGKRFQTTGSREIAIDAFYPDQGRESCPSIIIFHGVAGATPIMRRSFHYINASAIRDLGYNVYFARYFDGMGFDNLMLTDDNGNLNADKIDKVVQKKYKTQLIEGVAVAIREVRDRNEADRLGVIAYSLGCFVSFDAIAAMPPDSCPDFLIANFGAAWDDTTFDDSFPPTTFFHGKEDSVISYCDARKTVNRMKSEGVKSVELRELPGQDHVPAGPAAYQLRLDTLKKIKQYLGELGAESKTKTPSTTTKKDASAK